MIKYHSYKITAIVLLTMTLFSCNNQENKTISSNEPKTTIEVTKDQLKLMNNVYVPAFTDTCNSVDGEIFKILLLGNSILHHGKAESIGWNNNHGMAASSQNKDYAHRLFSKISERLPNKKICFRMANLAEFERNFASYNLNSINDLTNFKADIIVSQLGENVFLNEKNTPELFEEKYIDFIKYIRGNNKSIVIITTPFFPSLNNAKSIEKVALQTKSYLADLSHLTLLDDENYAIKEKQYPADKTQWKVDGIGSHPGDLGMKNISQQIFIQINAVLENTNNTK